MSELQNKVMVAVEPRRVGFIRDDAEWYVHDFGKIRFRSPVLLPWIRDHTTGRFYLDSATVAFDNELDFLVFRLSYND